MASSGNFKKHQEAVVRRAEIGFLTISQLMYKIGEFPAGLLMKVFDTMVFPILGYGVEISGPYLDRNFIDRLGAKLCKTILGIKGGISNDGVLKEFERLG